MGCLLVHLESSLEEEGGVRRSGGGGQRPRPRELGLQPLQVAPDLIPGNVGPYIVRGQLSLVAETN